MTCTNCADWVKWLMQHRECFSTFIHTNEGVLHREMLHAGGAQRISNKTKAIRAPVSTIIDLHKVFKSNSIDCFSITLWRKYFP